MKTGNEFYTAKEKLGLLAFGDPGTGDKIQVTDTYLISVARKIDNKIKQYPEFKKKLVKIKKLSQKTKQVIESFKKAQSQDVDDQIRKINIDEIVSEIKLPTPKVPDVSIIIPAFNKVSLTINCLRSLANNLDGRIKFQTILVNNASSDETAKLKGISGLTYVYNKENLGFVGGSNSGIVPAKGKYLVFLNNDAEVDSEWLYELYNTIDNDTSIGLVGSKIIYPNGKLQEAGGVIFKDGTGLNYGKFDKSDSYQYNYVKDVDYCSGASLIISKKHMDEFGGFDKLYNPAYYEDTDLCFKTRKAGRRVVYQPRSIIYHIEGGTSGTNLNTGFKKYQEINHRKFLKRWDSTLKHQVSPNNSYLGRDRSGTKLALVIEETLPTPDKDSGSVRMMAMIKALQKLGYKVTFWPNDMQKKEPYASKMQQLGIEVVYGNVDFMQFSKHYATYYDLVIMSRPEVCARYINICKSHYTNAKLVYDTVDLHYLRLARQAEIELKNSEALIEQSKWYKILETGLMERTDATFVVSEKEVEILKNEGVNAHVMVVSNIHSVVDDAYNYGFDERKDVVFVGNYAHLPNRDALLWFISEILPDVVRNNPTVKINIVGANLPEDLRKKLTAKNLIVRGFLSDNQLSDLLKNTRVFIAPLRYGAGVKGKIGQAIEYGIPVVSTTIGAEGMHLINGKSAAVTDDSKEFAKAINELLTSKKVWQAYRDNAKSIISKYFSIELAESSISRL